MEDKTPTPSKQTDAKSEIPVAGAQPLGPMDLNAIRLDTTHTVLTPGYLESKIANVSENHA